MGWQKAAEQVTHIAAQIEPEEGRLIDPRGARKFLRKYMNNAHISLYWGQPEDFLGELARELKLDGEGDSAGQEGSS